MLPSILQAAAADLSAGDDATLLLLGLLSAGRNFEVFLHRAAPALDSTEPTSPEPTPPDPPLALALGILAFQRHLSAKLDAVLRDGDAGAVPSAAAEDAPRPALRGLLR